MHFNTIQGSGGTRKTIEACIQQLVEEVLPEANKAQRQPCCVSELIVALQCGGSDGLSGITANPALGMAVDKLVRMGGSAILAETTEVYGAEHLLTRRSVSESGQKLVDRIHWWEDYAAKLDGEINNPTLGNKEALPPFCENPWCNLQGGFHQFNRRFALRRAIKPKV